MLSLVALDYFVLYLYRNLINYFQPSLEGALSTLECKYCNVCRWGLRGEIKAGEGKRCLAIFNDER